jgi:hypothetical protein
MFLLAIVSRFKTCELQCNVPLRSASRSNLAKTVQDEDDRGVEEEAAALIGDEVDNGAMARVKTVSWKKMQKMRQRWMERQNRLALPLRNLALEVFDSVKESPRLFPWWRTSSSSIDSM